MVAGFVVMISHMPVTYFDHIPVYSCLPPSPGCFSKGQIHSQNLRGTREGSEGQAPVSERRRGAWKKAQKERGGAERERGGAGESAFAPTECKDPALSEKAPTMEPGPRVGPAVEV